MKLSQSGNWETPDPIKGRICFLQDGKPSEFLSRNAYFVVIFRRKEVLK